MLAFDVGVLSLEFESMAVAKKKIVATKVKERAVIVCTEYKGVFFGYATDTSGDNIKLRDARMAIYWGTTAGVMELAKSGPTPKSKISSPADMEARKITSIFEVSPEALVKWEALS